MSKEYTPSDYAVKVNYALNRLAHHTPHEPYAIFDRWLAKHDAELRTEIAAELRGELPVQLAETAQSPSGWLADAHVWLPEPDALYERIDLESYDGDVGSIDISHIAEHAARIAEGAGE